MREGRPRPLDHVGLAVAARFRHLCEVHARRCRADRLMAAKGWSRPFDDPIPLPDGRQLVTLKTLPTKS
jgi:hypothetical protein